ncbi:MAG: hypothetical protein DMF88_03360, partial [Acidobacteria bacterium]
METVADLRKRCASSIEKLKLFLFMIAGATFNDVYRDRESGAARLRREFECQMRTAKLMPRPTASRTYLPALLRR